VSRSEHYRLSVIINGHMHLRSLRDTLEKVTEPVGATGHTDTVTAA
jgi:hypothetical protein